MSPLDCCRPLYTYSCIHTKLHVQDWQGWSTSITMIYSWCLQRHRKGPCWLIQGDNRPVRRGPVRGRKGAPLVTKPRGHWSHTMHGGLSIDWEYTAESIVPVQCFGWVALTSEAVKRFVKKKYLCLVLEQGCSQAPHNALSGGNKASLYLHSQWERDRRNLHHEREQTLAPWPPGKSSELWCYHGPSRP